MPEQNWNTRILNTRWKELILPFTVIACLLIIFAPLPAAVMDLLLAINIAVSVIILLTTFFVRTPLEFNVFPSLLLVTTIGRLSLNIATTRLILTHGATTQESAAGQLIQSFGEFVAGDHIAIGLVIFAIIVIIQFVVITRGATRISEVTARFALDGMPGRQMSIDADLNAGVIDNEEAARRRQHLTASSDFYGAMDGASKFVRGDAVAGILITVVNIAGGLIVGITSNMSLVESASVFTRLTIGDGLASQLPALFTSIAAAMLVTRPTAESNLPKDSFVQLSNKPVVLVITSIFLTALLFTSLPKIPLLLLAATFLLAARMLKPEPVELSSPDKNTNAKSNQPAELTIDRLLGNEILEMELGLDLVPLADPKLGGTLLPSVTNIRKKLASDLGVILPKIRIKDNLDLPPQEYRILVQGNPVDIGTIFPNLCLATDVGTSSGPIPGAVATESTGQGQAFWIPDENRPNAEQLGYRVEGATSVLIHRMSEIANNNAADLLTRDATNQLIEETRKTSPAIVNELLPDLIDLKYLQKILKQLVAEKVSIRPLGLILETIGDAHSRGGVDYWQLIEEIRERLAPQITTRHLGNSHAIKAITIAEDLQAEIAAHCKLDGEDVQSTLEPKTMTAIIGSLQQGIETMRSSNLNPILCVRHDIRAIVSILARTNHLEMIVLGSREIVGTYVESIGEISKDQLQAQTASAAAA